MWPFKARSARRARPVDGQVNYADSPFDDFEEARIGTIAELTVERLIDEMISRGGFDARASEVFDAIQARDYGRRAIARFPYLEGRDAI